MKALTVQDLHSLKQAESKLLGTNLQLFNHAVAGASLVGEREELNSDWEESVMSSAQESPVDQLCLHIQLIRKWLHLWRILNFYVSAFWLEQILVYKAVLAFLLLVSLSSLIFPIGLEAIKPTSKLKIISKFSRGTPRQLEFHFNSCFAVQVDSIQAVQVLASATLTFASFRSICKHCRLCRRLYALGFEDL